ncbi:restriction endonuclease subunit S [Candidatus Avelusimicrobium fimicolum]|uniref:restriction endonuclease subunit S n=1 Tax=Candidatus Avelusimicrobium fimicolum TaxID=3416216 RepID=UPI003D137846
MLLKKRFVKLKNLCEQIRGVSYTPKDVRDTPAEGYLPVLRANNIQDKITLDDLVYVNHKKIGAEQLLKEGDILICASSGSKKIVGKAVMVHNLTIQPASFGAFCKIVRPTKIYAPYLAHFFNSSYYRNTISHTALGANINNIRNEHINNLDIPYPDQTEQKRIAERLDKVQELIALQKEQLKKLDDLIKSRFIDLFGDPITNSKKFKIDTLNNICDVRDGTHASPEYVLKGYPLITSKNIINGEISLEEVNFITKLDFDNINKRSKVDVGDILLPMIGTIGNPALVEQEPNYAIKNMALIKFWPQSRCSNLYILYLLRSSFLDNIIKNQQRGGTQKFLALKTIRGLQIPIPPISSQVQFADFVTKIEAQKGLLATRLSHLETLYKSLMQEYFG